ncbi:hypothetical protein FLAG1_01187 [Fusarium langsethiae]|uniref:Uncharacterized protein n=1 Tax=Fusarium langsethiae TaxID=179993 RepID=A0A0N0DHQ1_FUSLA|nr:hypothetical protein FLAG1_01187 [Fusarium langsethiae]
MTFDMDDGDSDSEGCLIKNELCEDQTSRHTRRSVGADNASQDLADAQVTVARLDEKYRDLEEMMETHILSLRGDIKTLKLEHSQCASYAKVVNDLKEQVDRLLVRGTTNEILMENQKLHIAISELQDMKQDQKKKIRKLTRENQELHQVMDQQRTEINNPEAELDDVQDEKFGLTHVQDDMTHRLKELSNENDRLKKDLVEERRKSQHLQNSHPSEARMYESEITTLRSLLADKESKLKFLETIAPKHAISPRVKTTLTPPTLYPSSFASSSTQNSTVEIAPTYLTMPKGPPNRRPSYRARPYGNWSVTYNQPQQPSFLESYPDTNNENQDPTATQPVAQAGEIALDENVQPVAQAGECALGENVQPAEGMVQQENTPTVDSDNFNTGANEPPHGPRYGPWRRPYYDSYRPPPSLNHGGHRGGGTQHDVFTKVPNTSKTIAFRVESEETLIQAYRQAKAMNPSASVGGIMFSVAPKTESPFTEIDNVRWGSLTGRRSFNSRFTTAPARAFRSEFSPLLSHLAVADDK